MLYLKLFVLSEKNDDPNSIYIWKGFLAYRKDILIYLASKITPQSGGSQSPNRKNVSAPSSCQRPSR